MNRLIDQFLERFIRPFAPLPAGVYHYQSPADAEKPRKLHLRLEPNGNGLLILNASTVLHLNPTAAEYAYHLVKGTPDMSAARQVSRRYKVKEEQAYLDYLSLQQRIDSLLSTTDLDPESFLDMERMDPYSGPLSAPYRLDCALTYHTPEGSAGLSPVDRVKRELTRDEWCVILDKAWAAGIPHVVFTGGEPTLRPDLPDLVSHAEKLGQVTGLLTDGLRLSETKFLHSLLQSGLDHILMVLDPTQEQSWEALRDVLAEDIHVTTHLTISPQNVEHILSHLEILEGMGLKYISFSAQSEALKEALQAARKAAAGRGMTLVWDLPVPYSHLHPVSLELTEEGTRVDGAGHAWLYVEPDGDVLPAQGRYGEVLGNLLSDEWAGIWKS